MILFIVAHALYSLELKIGHHFPYRLADDKNKLKPEVDVGVGCVVPSIVSTQQLFRLFCCTNLLLKIHIYYGHTI